MALERQLRVVDGSNLVNLGVRPEPGVKVAFATSDLKQVDQHFGSSERFAIYQVSSGGALLLEVAEFGSLRQDGHEGKLLEKFALLDGCVAVYCQAVGASAVRQLMGMNVQPLKVEEGTTIQGLLDGLQQELKNGPSGWLARAFARNAPREDDRFDAMENEGWEE